MSPRPEAPPRRHQLTVGDYHRLAEVGMLSAEQRVELIDGEIIDVPPPGSVHAGTVDEFADLLRQSLRDARAATIRVQSPIQLDDFSEPQPDITLLHRRADFYKSAHPQPRDILLIIEVAQASLAYDRATKAPLYARHGIPELWIVDLEHGSLIVHREPTETGYLKVARCAAGAVVEIESLPGVSVRVPALHGF